MRGKKCKDHWEEMERRQRYLGEYLKGKRQEGRILEQIQMLRESKLFPAMKYDWMPHGNGHSDLSDYTVLMEELIEELKVERLETIRAYDKIYKIIRSVKEEKEREVLERRYLLGRSWETLALEMSFSYSYALKIHQRALMGLGEHCED